MYLDLIENKFQQGKKVFIYKDVYINRVQQKKIIYLKFKIFF